MNKPCKVEIIFFIFDSNSHININIYCNLLDGSITSSIRSEILIPPRKPSAVLYWAVVV